MDMKELARYGAQARIKELQAEIVAIQRAFPELGGAGIIGSARRRSRARNFRADAVVELPKRRGMSTANRKAASERMKAYWAKRRAGKKR